MAHHPWNSREFTHSYSVEEFLNSESVHSPEAAKVVYVPPTVSQCSCKDQVPGKFIVFYQEW
jgi:hypothetical protein